MRCLGAFRLARNMPAKASNMLALPTEPPIDAVIKCAVPGSAGLQPVCAGMLPACLCNAQDFFAKSALPF